MTRTELIDRRILEWTRERNDLTEKLEKLPVYPFSLERHDQLIEDIAACNRAISRLDAMRSARTYRCAKCNREASIANGGSANKYLCACVPDGVEMERSV